MAWHAFLPLLSVVVPVFMCLCESRVEGCLTGGWVTSVSCSPTVIFLYLVPVTVPSGVCNLCFGSICTAISSFPSVSWTVRTLTDLWEMVIHAWVTYVIWYIDFRRPTGTLILLAVDLKCKTYCYPVHTLLLHFIESILNSRTMVSWHWLRPIHTPHNMNTKHKVIQICVTHNI